MQPAPSTSHILPFISHAHPLLGVTLPRDQLYLESYLGSGGFSVVFRGVQIHTGEVYAVKTIPFAPTGTPLNSQQKAEACLHTRASGHPNVVKIHKYFLHQHSGVEYLILIMDLILGPNLHELINAGFSIQRPQYLRRLFGQMLDAVIHCHEKGIYHRDLKPQNFLCSEDLTTVYLTDFGLATVEPFFCHVELGSTAFMSPEVAHCADPMTLIHAPSTDVWSLGVLLVTLLTGCAPWQSASIDDATFSLFAINPSSLFTRHPMPAPVEMLLRRALNCDPHERICLSELRAAFLLLDNADLVLPRGNLYEGDLARAALLHRASPGLISDSGSAESSSESTSLDTPSAHSSQSSSLVIFKDMDM